MSGVLAVFSSESAVSRLVSKNINIKTHSAIILPALLHGCEIWSFTLQEGHWLKVVENGVMRRKIGPKREEVTGGW